MDSWLLTPYCGETDSAQCAVSYFTENDSAQYYTAVRLTQRSMILRGDFTTIWNLVSAQYHTSLKLTPRSIKLRGDRISAASYCAESCFVGFFYSRWYDTAWSQAFILFYICLHFNSFLCYLFLFIILQATWCFFYFTGYVVFLLFYRLRGVILFYRLVFLLFHRLRGNAQFGLRSLVYPGYL